MVHSCVQVNCHAQPQFIPGSNDTVKDTFKDTVKDTFNSLGGVDHWKVL
jgi:hypothetical protein